MNIIHKFLKPSTFDELQRLILDKNFPWYYTQSPGEPEQYTNLLYYDHEFSEDVTPKMKRILAILCTQLNAISILRIKLNSTPRNAPKQGWHVDWKLSTPSKTCVFYLNDCDGYTEFSGECPFAENKSYTIANNALIFDTNIEHRGVPQKDTDRRIVMNVNYFES